jgi:hypothetical protein
MSAVPAESVPGRGVPGRCGKCGYMLTAAGHKVTCGGEP